ncbi:hypothetical protein GDO86_003188 [Hymenochirus boettgeri]|uniref:Uncharacterized protein n=1 Tax=Hymenochirus boettgeri TaxID=247094 RepID=A0A8T2K451_9PIPI|nr:hypothetical protein GDO86_003188 [Hymenochirus boettgeri]
MLRNKNVSYTVPEGSPSQVMLELEMPALFIYVMCTSCLPKGLKKTKQKKEHTHLAVITSEVFICQNKNHTNLRSFHPYDVMNIKKNIAVVIVGIKKFVFLAEQPNRKQ